MTNLFLLGFMPSGSEWIIILLVILLLLNKAKEEIDEPENKEKKDN